MDADRNTFLIVGAALSAIAAALHIGCIFFGAPWYRFFGAGERIARLAESGSWYPTIVTSVIVVVLIAWSLYALSGAGLVVRLPLLRPALCVITAIYLLRGLVLVPLFLLAPDRTTAFWMWSSAICLVFGMVHLVGTSQAWTRL
jgi:hypothetical protein